MKKIIRLTPQDVPAIVEDVWQVLGYGETAEASIDLSVDALSTQPTIFPFSQIDRLAAQIQARSPDINGLWLAPDDDLERLGEYVGLVSVIALDFPVFRDGRAYSMATHIRRRLEWSGELRAIGDVLRDQLYLMKRCGFDAFAVREDKDINDAIQGFNDFSVRYQAAVDESQPLYLRVTRS